MTYQQTLQDQLAEFDEKYPEEKDFDDICIDREEIKQFLTSFAEEIAQSVREEQRKELEDEVHRVQKACADADGIVDGVTALHEVLEFIRSKK